MSKWISVDEQLPKDGQEVMVAYIHKNEIHQFNLASIIDGTWNVLTQVTHWHPLPEPPREV